MTPAERLQDYLYEHIPLSVAMQVKVDQYDGHSLQLSVPLAANHNDKGTGFAGSISSLAALSGWGLAMLWAQERIPGECQAAIAHADIQYRKPIRTDFRALATLPSPEDIATLQQRIAEKGRGKLQVHIEVSDAHGVAVTQIAEYAIWKLEVE